MSTREYLAGSDNEVAMSIESLSLTCSNLEMDLALHEHHYCFDFPLSTPSSLSTKLLESSHLLGYDKRQSLGRDIFVILIMR
jgi:hypothetical protein